MNPPSFIIRIFTLDPVSTLVHVGLRTFSRAGCCENPASKKPKGAN